MKNENNFLAFGLGAWATLTLVIAAGYAVKWWRER